MTDGNAGTRTVIYRLQCAALINGCWSALVIDGPVNVDIDALDQAVPEDRRIDNLIRTAGWAFEPCVDTTVGQMLAAARSARGATYQGWKGGEYEMADWTDCWLAEEGRGNGEILGPILLTLLLAGDQLDATTREKLARFEPETARWDRESAWPND